MLLPAALRLRKSDDPNRIRGLQGMDYLLLGYGILTVAFFVPPDRPDQVILHNSFTNVLRDSFLFVLDIYLVYYVASRSATSKRVIVEALAAFCLSCTVWPRSPPSSPRSTGCCTTSCSSPGAAI